MILTYFGHSAFQIEAGGATLLFDPFITGNKHTSGVVRAEDLHPDLIFLTHAHGDHWGDTMDIAQRSGALVVGNFEVTNYVQAQGHAHVYPLNTGGTGHFDFGRATMTYARHSSSFPDGTYGGNPNGYLLHAEGRCIYNTGDTSAFAEMAWIGEDHQVDCMLMPVGDRFTMGSRGSIRAAAMVGARQNIPLHYDTFAPIETDIGAWAAAMGRAGLPAHILAPGECLTLAAA